MKKEIIELLESENSYLRINKFCRLRRWQKDALGNAVDGLSIEFEGISVSEKTVEIEERDWKNIVDRIQKEQTIFFEKLTEKLNKDLQNGYIY